MALNFRVHQNCLEEGQQQVTSKSSLPSVFCNYNFPGREHCPFISMLSVATFVLQQQSWIAIKLYGPQTLKYLLFLPFREKTDLKGLFKYNYWDVLEFLIQKIWDREASQFPFLSVPKSCCWFEDHTFLLTNELCNLLKIILQLKMYVETENCP